MDETIRAIDNHISDCNRNMENDRQSQEVRAMLAQAKSTALLAKVIAHGIKEAAEQE